MYDKELAIEILRQIYQSTQKIIARFKPINTPEDFTGSETGMEKLDAICMQMIAIGENLKNLDKVTEHSLLANYPQIEWNKVKAMRDIISHHYFDLNAEAIFEVCKNRIQPLALVIKKIEDDLI